MAYNYTIKFNGDISNIESLLSKKLYKEIQKVEDNKITFTFDFKNGIDDLQEKLDDISKYLDPTIGVQFKYEVNKKLLEDTKNELQKEINDGFGESKNAEHLRKVIEEITAQMKELQNLGANPDYISNVSEEAKKAQETIESLEKSVKDLNDKLSQSVSIEEFDELKKQIDDANQRISELVNKNEELQNELNGKGDYHFSYFDDFVEAQKQAEELKTEIEQLKQELLIASSAGSGSGGNGALGFNVSAINRIVAAVEKISDAIGEIPEDGQNLLHFIQEVNESLKEVYTNVQEISLVGTNVHIDMGDAQSIESKQYLRKQFKTYKESYEKFFNSKFINPTNVFSAIASDKKYGEIFGYDIENVKKRFGIDEITSLKDAEDQVKRIIEFFNTIDAVIKSRKKTAGYDKNAEFNKELASANARAKRVVKNRDISVIDEEMKAIENGVGQDILDRVNGKTDDGAKNASRTLGDVVDKLEEIRNILKKITSDNKIEQILDNVISKLERISGVIKGEDSTKLFEEPSGQMAFFDGLKEKEQQIQEEAKETNEQIKGQLSLFDNKPATELFEESSGQLAFVEGLKEKEEKLQEEVKETNEQIEGQISLLDYINSNKEDSTKLFEEESGQLAFIEGLKEQENKLQEEVKETNEQIEGQISLFDTPVSSDNSQILSKKQAVKKLNEELEISKNAADELISTSFEKIGNKFEIPLKKLDELISKEKEAAKASQNDNTSSVKKNKTEKEQIKEVKKAYETLISTEEKFQQLENKRNRSDLSKSEIYTYTKLNEQRKQAQAIIDASSEKIKKEVGLEQEHLNIINQVTKALEEQNKVEDKERSDKLKSDLQSLIDKTEKMSVNPKFIESFRNELRDAAFKATDALSGTDDEIIEITGDLEKLTSNIPKDKLESSFTKLEKLGLDVANILNNNTAMSSRLRKEFEKLGMEIQQALDSGHWNDIGGLQEYQQKLLKLQKIMKQTGQDGDSMWRRIGNRLADMNSKMIAQYLSWQDIIRYIRQISGEVIKLDTALTELRKVSDAPDDRLQQSLGKSTETAKELGDTIDDVIKVTSDWARLGYNVDEAEELARVTTLFKNVGDNMSAEDASSFMISTLKGFEMEADQAMDIADKFNEVANNFAIDTMGIGDALQRSAASFNAANTDLNESIALITATNAVVQNPESVGTMWKTVSARIRGAKAELEEAGEDTEGMVESTSKLRALVKGFTGFDIMEDEKTFKSIYDIILGIGEKWQDLNDIDRAALLEALAGKRAGNALAAALNNVDDLKAAYETALNASGSAMKEQENYEQSIQYSIDRLKATAQDLAQDFMSSDLIKGSIDFLNTILELLDKIVEKTGNLTPIITALGTAFASIKISKNVGGFLDIVSTSLDGDGNNKKSILSGGLSDLLNKEITIGAKKATKSVIDNIDPKDLEMLSNSMYGVEIASVETSSAVGGLTLSVGKLLGILGVIAIAIYAGKKAWDYYNVTVEEVQQNIDDINGRIQTLKSELEELENTKKNDEGTKNRISLLKQEIALEERALEVENERKQQELLGTGFTDFFDEESLMRRSVENGKETTPGAKIFNLESSTKEYQNYVNAINDINKQLKTESDERVIQELESMKDSYLKEAHALTDKDIPAQINELEKRAIEYKSIALEYEKYGVDKDTNNASYSYWKAARDNYNKDMKAIIDSRKSIGEYDIFEHGFINKDNEHKFLSELEDFNEEAIKELINSDKSDKYIEAELKKIVDSLKIEGLTVDALIDKYGELKTAEEKVAKIKPNLSVKELFIKSDEDIDIDNEIADLKKQYAEEWNRVNDLGVNVQQTVFGNIDLNNRAILTWTDSVMEEYKDILQSWEEDAVYDWESFKNELDGTISTVYGGSDNYEGIEIAFSPMLQKSDGTAELLSREVVDEYIYSILETANGDLSKENLLRLDTIGLEIDGKKIQGLLADIGETAIQTGEAMHYLGKEGSLQLIVNEMRNLEKQSSGIRKIKTDLIGLAQSGKLDEDTLKSYDKLNELLKALGITGGATDEVIKQLVDDINKIAIDNSVDDLNTFGTAIDKLGEAYKAFSEGKRITAAQLSEIQTQFGDLGDDYQQFENAVLSGNTDLQSSFNQLVTAYAKQLDIFDKLNETNKEYYISELQSKGITNASAVVNKYLADAQEYRKSVENDLIECNLTLNDTQGDLYISTEQLENATAQEVAELVGEAKQSGVTADALAIFALKKRVAAGINLANSGDITYLLSLAKAAGVAAEEMQAVADAKAAFEGAQTALQNARKNSKGRSDTYFFSLEQDVRNARKALEDAGKAAEDAVNNFEPVSLDLDFGYDYNKSDAAKEAAKSGEKSAETFDWLETKIQRCEEEIQRLDKTVSATYKGWSKRNGAIASELDKVREKIQLQMTAYDVYMKKANSIGLSDTYKQLVMHGGLKIEEISDENLKKQINDFKTFYEKAIAAKDAIEDLNAQLAQLAKQKFDNVKSEFEGFTSEIEHFVNMIDKELSHVENMEKIVGKSFYTAKMDQDEQRLEELNKERTALLQALREAEANGVEVGSADWIAMRNDIYSVDEAIADLTYEVEDLKKKMKEVAKLNFDNLKSQFENAISIITGQIDLTDSVVSMTQNAGYIASREYYKALIEGSKENVTGLRKEYETLSSTLADAMKAGDIDKYSEKWYQMSGDINNVKKELVDAANATIEYANALRQIDWDVFDRGLDRISKLVDESEFLQELMSWDDKLKDLDTGEWTAKGIAKQGLMVQDYQSYMSQANAYGSEAEEIRKLLETDPKNTVLIDRYHELLEAQRQAILNALKEKKALTDLVKEGYDALLEKIKKLIDEYKEALDSAKDLMDYSNSINEKTKNIADLSKQLTAYQGMSGTEEGRATIQKLQSQLEDAQKDLEQTEYDKYVSDQKDLLDNFYTELEEYLEGKYQETNILFEEAVAATNENGKLIDDTLHQEASAVNYRMTDEFTNIWDKYADEGGIAASTLNILDLTNVVTNDIRAKMEELPTEARLEEFFNSDDLRLLQELTGVKNNTENMIGAINETTSAINQISSNIVEYSGLIMNKLDGVADAVNNLDLSVDVNVDASTGSTSVSGGGGGSSSGGGSPKTTTTSKTGNTNRNYYVTGYSPYGGTSYRRDDLTLAEAQKIEKDFEKLGGSIIVHHYAKGGLIGKNNNILDSIAKLLGEDHMIAAKEGERILTEEQNKAFEKMVNTNFTPLNDEERNKYTIDKMIEGMTHIQTPNVGNVSNIGNTTTVGDINITLPNVTNKEEFVQWLRTDGQVEKIIQSLTIGRMMGKNSFEKMKY